MKCVFLIPLLLIVAHCGAAGKDQPLAEIAKSVNALNLTWQAHVPDFFLNHTLDDFRVMCGSKTKSDPGYFPLPESETLTVLPDLSVDFDTRTHWPKCLPVTGLIRDQSKCGSCWAFGPTGAFNDRYCIATGSRKILSAADTNACAPGRGCDGGQPTAVWPWFRSAGVCTGGLYKASGTCKPYEFAPCAHHVPPSAKYPNCPSSDYKTPSCKASCTDGSYTTSYSQDKVHGRSAYSVSGVARIMSEIQSNGPVAAVFTVFSDFPTYKSGVYAPASTAQPLGGHAIKIIGFGDDGHCKAISASVTDDWCSSNCCARPPNCPATLCKCDKPNPGGAYWLVANSWNDEWGNKGFFKIKRGANTCGIEGDVSAGMP